MRKFLPYILALIIVLATVGICFLPPCNGGESPEGENPGEENPPAEETPDASEYADRDVTGRNIAHVTFKIKYYVGNKKTTGTVKLLLDATSAPRTVANFLTLAKSGFYDGLDFFSTAQMDESSTVIFAGDPTVNGDEAWEDTITGEFSYNGYDNDLLHKRGVISMLHTNINDARSAFFITNADISGLDGYYAPFGYVVSGYAVIEDIIKLATYYTNSTTGLVVKDIRPVITSVTVEQDIDYSLVSDVYLAPPADSDLSEVLGAEARPERFYINYAPSSVFRSYKTDSEYAFHVSKKNDSVLTNLLVSVSAYGIIKKATALPLSADIEEAELSALEGVSLETLDTAELSDSLKAVATDVLNTVREFSASEYSFTRDAEGRETYTVEMKVEGYDSPVVILLDKTTAPITVTNFLSLVEQGFYDGLDFHRIIKDFMIQGGDDSHLPKEEQAATIKGEFSSNGHENDILHLRGTISMARASDPDSASCGFFICDADASWLDGEYAAFGYVLSGMETVDAIADYSVGKTDRNGNLNSSVEQPVIEYIKVVENAN